MLLGGLGGQAPGGVLALLSASCNAACPVPSCCCLVLLSGCPDRCRGFRGHWWLRQTGLATASQRWSGHALRRCKFRWCIAQATYRLLSPKRTLVGRAIVCAGTLPGAPSPLTACYLISPAAAGRGQDRGTRYGIGRWVRFQPTTTVWFTLPVRDYRSLPARCPVDCRGSPGLASRSGRKPCRLLTGRVGYSPWPIYFHFLRSVGRMHTSLGIPRTRYPVGLLHRRLIPQMS